MTAHAKPLNSPFQVLIASLIGTTIEFFDFYAYATAAVLVFPTLFFPSSDPTSGLLQSFATFSIAFFARPVGAMVFGHFGDRIGRKVTLVAALLTMGISTVVIGLLPGYAQIGVAAPLLLALCRFGQGFGLGGEWGGAVLLATENAPEGKRSWYGMFPQLGAPVGLLLSSGAFWLLLHVMPQSALLAWGWRIPFIASALLILLGLWMRLSLTETPAFQKAVEAEERVSVPLVEVFRRHKLPLLLGTFAALATFVLFYIASAWLLSYNVQTLHVPFLDALGIQMAGAVAFGVFTPLVAKLAERIGHRQSLVLTTVLIGLASFTLAPLLKGGEGLILVFAVLSMALMGMTFGLLGTTLSVMFPTRVRYTGASLTFNFAGIVGASLAPYIAVWLQRSYGLGAVGLYLLVSAVITLICVLLSPKEET